MNARASLWASLAIAASIGLAGCGGSSDNGDGMDPKPVPIPLSNLNIPDGMEPGDAMIDLAAGGSEELNGVKFTCAADGDPCKVMVKDGMAEATGGTVAPSLSQAAMDAIARIEGKDDRIDELEGQVKELEDKDRGEANAEDDRQTKMMAATAAKLHAGINARMTDIGADLDASSQPLNAVDGTFDAGYGNDEDEIVVVIGLSATGDTNNPQSFVLSEDDKATVAANHEWEGKRYIDAPGDDSYEAIVYSNVGDPMEGKKFGGAAADNEFQYALASGITDPDADIQNGEVSINTSSVAAQERVALMGVTRTSGKEDFKFSASEATKLRIDIPGSYHGVSGTYYCSPSDRAKGCSATVAKKGFTLDDGVWAFKPSDPNAKVTETDDSNYSSYGWWLKKTADGQTYTASAFHDFKGSDTTPAVAVPTAGTAKYMGGAAGKYAFSSSTGGLNEAGHFTARAELTATWGTGNAGTIDGTIDTFKVGDDAEDRAWIVHLHDAQITGAASGIIGFGGNNKADTTWERMEDDADASANGSWSGQLREQGEDGVPGAVTGVFYSEYGNAAGKMVGAFGAEVE